MPRPIRFLPALALALATLLSPTVHAQSAVVGIVADTAKVPLQGAEVAALKSGRTAVTDRNGIFILTGVPRGEEEIRIRRIGYKAQFFTADISGDDTLRIGVILEPAPQLLPEIGVEARGKVYKGLMAGFADRMLYSGAPPSAFITRDDLDKWNHNRLVDVVQKAGLKTRPDNFGRRLAICPRGQTGMPPDPAVYLNGVRVQGQFDLDNFEVDQVEALEVYKTPLETPSIFARNNAACVVVIWTR